MTTRDLARLLDEQLEPITGKDLYTPEQIAAALRMLADDWEADPKIAKCQCGNALTYDDEIDRELCAECILGLGESS